MCIICCFSITAGLPAWRWVLNQWRCCSDPRSTIEASPLTKQLSSGGRYKRIASWTHWLLRPLIIIIHELIKSIYCSLSVLIVSCLKNTSKNSVFTCVFSSITSYILKVFAFFCMMMYFLILLVFIDADLMCPLWNEKCEVPLLVQTILSILEIEVQPKSFGDPAEPGGLLQIQSTFLMYFFLV